MVEVEKNEAAPGIGTASSTIISLRIKLGKGRSAHVAAMYSTSPRAFRHGWVKTSWEACKASVSVNRKRPRPRVHLAGFAGSYHSAVRRHDEATAFLRRAAALQPGDFRARLGVVFSIFMARGDAGEVASLFATLPSDQREAPNVLEVRREWAVMRGDADEVLQLDAIQQRAGRQPTANSALETALALAKRNDLTGARAVLQPYVALAQSGVDADPDNPVKLGMLARIQAVLGRPNEALQAGRRAGELGLPGRSLPWVESGGAALAFVYAWIGEKDRAIAEYSRLLGFPSIRINVHVMKGDLRFAPLQGDPRFEALLKDPKNNAPLF